MNGVDIARQAKEQLEPLTGLQVNTVSGIRKDEEGWHVILELIELKRVPDCMDILASYSTLLDDNGNLLSYQRTKRYVRQETMNEEA